MSVTQAWHVAVNVPLLKNLTYLIPETLKPCARQIVRLPIKDHWAKGVLISPVAQSDSTPFEKINSTPYQWKTVEEILYDGWQIPDDYFRWAKWVSDYYVYPFGLVLESIYGLFPEIKKSQAGRPKKILFEPPINTTPLNQLTKDQENVFLSIERHTNFSVHLIDGVTGSGKTEIYLHLFDKVMKNDGQGLFLVPEISLTPQMIQRFTRVFGNTIAVWHSQLTSRQKHKTWIDIQSQKAKILIGARSALFCPIPNLRMIILDEEHDSSFKQDTKLRYHARTVAIKLAEIKNIPVVLGSATPSLETFHQVKMHHSYSYQLKNRVKTNLPTQIEVVDLRLTQKQRNKHKLPSWLSHHLYDKIKNALNNNHQVALFLNRRGYASIIFCFGCGYHEECPNCSVSLTMHYKTMMVCHYCGYQAAIPHECPSCRDSSLNPLGLGTEQVESDLRRLFPDKVTLRIDRDEVGHVSELENYLRIFENQQAQILVGTQMISKGLDFPNLKLVGIVLADLGFYLPDFRSAERSCQLLFQMSGRAGRHALTEESQGEIIVQTYQPNHPVFSFLRSQNYQNFLEQEYLSRQELCYPPFSRMALIHLEHSKDNVAKEDAYYCRRIIEFGANYFKLDPKKFKILGPTEAPLAKIRRKFRYQVILISPHSIALSQFCRWIIQQFRDKKRKSVFHVDIDPYQLL